MRMGDSLAVAADLVLSPQSPAASSIYLEDLLHKASVAGLAWSGLLPRVSGCDLGLSAPGPGAP